MLYLFLSRGLEVGMNAHGRDKREAQDGLMDRVG